MKSVRVVVKVLNATGSTYVMLTHQVYALLSFSYSNIQFSNDCTVVICSNCTYVHVDTCELATYKYAQ